MLARCFQLQDAIGVLELDRVLDADPDELEGASPRAEGRPGGAAGAPLAEHRASDGSHGRRLRASANAKVLLNPTKLARRWCRRATTWRSAVVGFQGASGSNASGESLEARRWSERRHRGEGQGARDGAGGLADGQRIGTSSARRSQVRWRQARPASSPAGARRLRGRRERAEESHGADSSLSDRQKILTNLAFLANRAFRPR